MPEQTINSRQSLEAYKAHLDAQFEKHKYLRVDLKTGKQRTSTQNRCLHLYCGQVAQELNDAGYDFRTALKEGIEVNWTMDLVKDYMWRPVQEALLGVESTTKPKTHEYNEIYEVLNRFISTRFGVYVPWPSVESMRDGVLQKEAGSGSS